MTNSQLAAAAGGETGAETHLHTCTQTVLKPAAVNATKERKRLRGRLRAVRERPGRGERLGAGAPMVRARWNDF